MRAARWSFWRFDQIFHAERLTWARLSTDRIAPIVAAAANRTSDKWAMSAKCPSFEVGQFAGQTLIANFGILPGTDPDGDWPICRVAFEGTTASGAQRSFTFRRWILLAAVGWT
jgi:hypothetical protein